MHRVDYGLWISNAGLSFAAWPLRYVAANVHTSQYGAVMVLILAMYFGACMGLIKGAIPALMASILRPSFAFCSISTIYLLAGATSSGLFPLVSAILASRYGSAAVALYFQVICLSKCVSLARPSLSAWQSSHPC